MHNNLKIDPISYWRMPVTAQHSLIDKWVNIVLTPELRQLIPALAPIATKLTDFNTKMEAVDTPMRGYDESKEISSLDVVTYNETMDLNSAFRFYATNRAVSAAEREAAESLLLQFKPYYEQKRRVLNMTSDQLKDVLKRLLEAPQLAKLTTIRMADAAQQLQAHNDQRIALREARAQEMRDRKDEDALYELCEEVRPWREDFFEVLEYHAKFGSDAQKTHARAAIKQINAQQDAVHKDMAAHETTLAKQKGEETPGHKPHDPNKPSDNEDRPEGVPPNEEGDEPGDGGDSSDNNENNTGDNTDDSGGSDNNQDPPSGGNNGGSDKPPNPESPD